MSYTPTTWTDLVTPVSATNMNHLETGVSDAATTADAAIPAPIGPATNAGLVWNGSAWVAAKLVDANIDAAAAIAYSKLTLAGSIVNNDVSTTAAIARSKLDFGSGLVNADIASGAAIAKSKLAALAIADADVATGAAIQTAKLAIITGSVTSAGVKNGGSGFTVARNSAGNYTVTFTSAFSGTPIVLPVANQNSGANPSAFIANAGTTSCQIITVVGGSATDTPFMFLAFLMA